VKNEKDWKAHWQGLNALLGHAFSAQGREGLLAACLHGSATQDFPEAAALKEQRRRLAWVGDRVVAIFLADHLAARLEDAPLKTLNDALDDLKSHGGLARAARTSGLAEFIIASANGAEQAQQDNPLGEFLEGVIGAVYADPEGGFAAAHAVAEKLLTQTIDDRLDPEVQRRETEELLARLAEMTS